MGECVCVFQAFKQDVTASTQQDKNKLGDGERIPQKVKHLAKKHTFTSFIKKTIYHKVQIITIIISAIRVLVI